MEGIVPDRDRRERDAVGVDVERIPDGVRGGMAVTNRDRRIAALEFAIDYVPGMDGNHSHSILLEMLAELRAEKLDPNGGNREEVQ